MELEKDGNLKKPLTWKAPKIKSRVTATIDSDFLKEIYKRGWNIPDLIEFAVQFKLAEMEDWRPYPECKLLQRMNKFKKLAEQQNSTQQTEEDLEMIKNGKPTE